MKYLVLSKCFPVFRGEQSKKVTPQFVTIINKGVKLEMYIYYLFSCSPSTRVGNYFVLTFQSNININIHSSNAIHHTRGQILMDILTGTFVTVELSRRMKC